MDWLPPNWAVYRCLCDITVLRSLLYRQYSWCQPVRVNNSGTIVIPLLSVDLPVITRLLPLREWKSSNALKQRQGVRWTLKLDNGGKNMIKKAQSQRSCQCRYWLTSSWCSCLPSWTRHGRGIEQLLQWFQVNLFYSFLEVRDVTKDVVVGVVPIVIARQTFFLVRFRNIYTRAYPGQ